MRKGENEQLKNRVNRLQSPMHSSFGAGVTSPERLRKDNDTLLKTVEEEIKARYEADSRCQQL